MTAISIKEYYAMNGSIYSNKDAAVIGPVLHELAQQGGVTARDVLDAARSDNSPIHPYFEWRDNVAADLWRLRQAQNIMWNIRVRYLDNHTGEEHDSKVLNVVRKALYDHEPRRYRSFEVLHGDSAFAAQMMDSAFDDLIAWRRKYEPYVGVWERFGDVFRSVVNQIDEFTEDMRATGNASLMDAAMVRLLGWRDEFAEGLETWTNYRQSLQYVMDAIADAESTLKKTRVEALRDCLRCRKPFKSAHPGHRICGNCFTTFDKRATGSVEAMNFRDPAQDEE
jgi:hypothetical protein